MMKQMKRFAAFMLAMMMVVCGMTMNVKAAEIIVDNAKKGETYTAYKIFDYVTAGEGEEISSYTYTINSESKWRTVIDAYTTGEGENEKDIFNFVADPSDGTTMFVTVDSSFTGETAAANFAAYLAANVPTGLTESADYKSITAAADGEIKFTDLDTGYYFVDTTLGSLCALVHNDSSKTAIEKNTIPTLDKTIQEDNKLSIGDTVEYTITVTDSKGTDKAAVVHDKMEAGLTLNKTTAEDGTTDTTFTITAKKTDGTTIDVVASDYSINYMPEVSEDCVDKTNGCSFEITFTAAFIEKLDEEDVITITYSATLNENAEIVTETNDNTAHLEYSEQITQDKTAEALSFKFDLDKVDGEDKALDGAKFRLYDAETEGNLIPVVKDGDVYRVAAADEIKNDADGIEIETVKGQATIIGLGNGDYYLEEVEAPDGYNILTGRQKLTINDDNEIRTTDADGKVTKYAVKVVNQAGAQLPETGGIGTTIFYIVGGILVLGAVVLLISKKRMSNVE